MRNTTLRDHREEKEERQDGLAFQVRSQREGVPCLNGEADIQDAELESVHERVEALPGDVTEPVHVYVYLEVVLSLQNSVRGQSL